ncbi:MAG: glycosyltransferase family 1 protein [Kiritimatiellia bacterium]|nr:glycosyltransferase family 1 protein [Kiritimatiellia bacterium]
MKVCIDIQSALAQRAGVGRYTRSLAEALGETRDPADELKLFYFDFRRKGLPFSVPGVRTCRVGWLPGRWVQKAWKTVKAPPFDWLSGSADIFHFPNFIRPPLSRGRSVVTLHDVSFLRFPEAAEERNRRYLTSRIQDTVHRADRILSDCDFVAREIVEMLGVSSDRVTTVYPGLSASFAPAPAETLRQVRVRYGLDRPYLLNVGTLEPRKNHVFLIEAFERMKGFDGDLVLAGMKGWKVEPILERIRRSPLCGRIRHLDYVADADLPALYTGAELFLFPSLYEGFGFPPLEALACGCPVLASTAESLVEVLGQGARLVKTDDAERWAEEARRILLDESGRTERRERGFARVSDFLWGTAAKKVWSIYREVLS